VSISRLYRDTRFSYSYNVAMTTSSRSSFKVFLFFLFCALPYDSFSATPPFADVKMLAMFSEASYHPAQTMTVLAKSYGYTLKKHGNLEDAQLQYFLLNHSQSGKQLIVIRGTANVENVVVDVSIKLVKDDFAQAMLHEGFSYSARSVLQILSDALDKNTPIDITGHSLGGAVALILGMYLDSAHYRVDRIYTYGQPKVTNIPGSLRFSHLNILRFVTADDLIPLVPPLDPLDLENIDIYWHVGEEVILLPGPNYSRIGVLNSMMRATKIFTNKLSEKNLQQHRMTSYLEAIDSKLNNATEVPFDSDIKVQDLMKLFQ